MFRVIKKSFIELLTLVGSVACVGVVAKVSNTKVFKSIKSYILKY